MAKKIGANPKGEKVPTKVEVKSTKVPTVSEQQKGK